MLEEGGMLDRYIGDAIMAVFNAPVDLPEHQKRACRCALRMIGKLRELNEGFRERYRLELDIGVGAVLIEVRKENRDELVENLLSLLDTS